MNLYSFFEKNFEDKSSIPLPAYYATTTSELIDALTVGERFKKREKKPTPIPKLTYNDWEVSTDEILNNKELINNWNKQLDAVVSLGIEDVNNEPITEQQKTKLKNAVQEFIDWVNLRKFPNGYLVDKNGNLNPNNDYLKQFYSEEVIKFINENGGATPTQDDDDTPADQQGEDGSEFISFLRSLQLLEHSIKNYTRLYMENSNRGIRTLLEAAFTEQQIKDIFEKQENLAKLLDLGTPEQINYVMYKIIEDLPDSSISKNLEEKIIGNKNASEGNFISMIKMGMRLQGITLNDDQLKKLYQAVTLPPPTSIPQGLESFGKPGGVGDYVSPGGISSTQPSPSAITSPGDTTATPPPEPEAPTNLNRMGEELRQNSSYRSGARGGGDSTRPISPAGGPTYYIRISPGRYRPAVQADMDANIPLFIKNPNPVAAMVNPYVRVADEIRKARRASPVDAQAIDREMRARGAQRLNPQGTTRKEADGSVRRKSQFGGALGSLSNLLGDAGNTIAGKGTSRRRR